MNTRSGEWFFFQHVAEFLRITIPNGVTILRPTVLYQASLLSELHLLLCYQISMAVIQGLLV